MTLEQINEEFAKSRIVDSVKFSERFVYFCKEDFEDEGVLKRAAIQVESIVLVQIADCRNAKLLPDAFLNDFFLSRKKSPKTKLVLVKYEITEYEVFKGNPTFEEINNALYELVVAGTADIITMVEMGGKEASEEMIMRGFEYAQKVLAELSAAQKDFIATVEAKYPITKMDLDIKAGIAGLEEKVFAVLSAEKIEALYNIGKIDFHHKLEEIIEEAKTALGYTEDTEELNGNEIGEVSFVSCIPTRARKRKSERRCSART